MRSGSSAKTSITVIIIIVVIALARKTTAVVVANASRVVNKRVVIYINYSYLRARLSDRAVKLLQSSWDGEMVLALPPGQGEYKYIYYVVYNYITI